MWRICVSQKQSKIYKILCKASFIRDVQRNWCMEVLKKSLFIWKTHKKRAKKFFFTFESSKKNAVVFYERSLRS